MNSLKIVKICRNCKKIMEDVDSLEDALLIPSFCNEECEKEYRENQYDESL